VTQKAVILHSWYGKIDRDWYPWLKTELEKRNYDVILKQIPTFDSDLPELETSLKFIESSVDNNTTIICHSLSCLLALRLAEMKSFAKMIIVAGWDFDDLCAEHKLFWKNKIDHDSTKKNVKEIYCLSSDNDPYITAYQAEEMSKRLNGKFILVTGAGHFTEKFGIKKIPELLSLI
jgi:uncharacterized protein